MTPMQRRTMAHRVLERAVARLRATMTPGTGAFLAGVPMATVGSVEDRIYITAGRIASRLEDGRPV